MSPRTPTLPPHEPLMWRKLLARAHPDAGGDHELFVWTSHVREVVCSDGVDYRGRVSYQPPPQRTRAGSERLSFGWSSLSFGELTVRAMEVGAEAGEPYASLLRLLADCGTAYEGTLAAQQAKGATYKQLAAIGHRAGMDKPQRVCWYRVAEVIPLSQRHAGHILGKLAEAAA